MITICDACGKKVRCYKISAMGSKENVEGPVIKKLLENYELYAKAAGFSPGQINTVRLSLRLFDQFLGGIDNIENVTADDFRRFLADLRTRPLWQGLRIEKQRNLSPATINTYARTIKTFFKWLQKENYIAVNPLASVPTPPVGQRVSKAYSEDQIRKVLNLDSLNARDKAIFYLFTDSGVRVDELSTLKIGEIDLNKKHAKVIGKGRGKKERYVYFGPDAAEIIGIYIIESRKGASKDDFLFIKRNGKPLTNSGIRSMLVRLGKKVGFQGRLAPHKLRHTFATLSLNYGASREDLQKEMGHSSPKTTEGYLHAPDSDIGAAHQLFSPLSNILRSDTNKSPSEIDTKTTSSQYKNNQTQHGHSISIDDQIRSLAVSLQQSIGLPWIKDHFIPELRPGLLTLGKNGFPIGISEQGEIKVTFSISVADKSDLITHALRSHLETGGFADVLSKILTWGNKVAEYFLSCHTLLTDVRSDIEGKDDVSIPIDDDTPGFTIDFPILVCADAVDQARGFEHFKSYSYRKDGPNLKFGAYIIYGGTPNENLRSREEFHKNLRTKWAKTEQTKLIANRSQELEDEALTINRQLQRFLAYPNLPGYCELCSRDI